MELRHYQINAVNAIYAHLRERDDNPCVVIPTGGGKTPVIAQICKDAVGWGGRVLVLAHVRELLEQAHDKLMTMAPELAMNVGIYSAGLNSRDTEHEIIIAGIQSAYRKTQSLGRFDICLIDEAHRIASDDDTMYGQLITGLKEINPLTRIIGLTATPYRLGQGLICSPENVLNHVCYEVGVRELMVDGFLSKLRSKGGAVEADTSSLHIRGGEFIASEAESLMNDSDLVSAAVSDIIHQTRDRRSCLIFCTGIDHANSVIEQIRHRGHDAEGIFGETDSIFRTQVIERFKAGDLKYLVNVNVLTLGFDAPNVDCVVLLRPTMSPGLYYQMVGRGFRLCEGKADALVLDYAGNIERHGPVDRITPPGEPKAMDGEAPIKKCPQCREYVPCGCLICPVCGFEFPARAEAKHDGRSSSASVLSGEVTEERFAVIDTIYSKWIKRNAPDAPPTMRVDYRVGYVDVKSEWICFEHDGYAREKAVAWWRKRSKAPLPSTVDEAIGWADAGALAPTLFIDYRMVSGEKYGRISGYAIGDIPTPPVLHDDGTVDISSDMMSIPDEDLPF